MSYFMFHFGRANSTIAQLLNDSDVKFIGIIADYDRAEGCQHLFITRTEKGFNASARTYENYKMVDGFEGEVTDIRSYLNSGSVEELEIRADGRDWYDSKLVSSFKANGMKRLSIRVEFIGWDEAVFTFSGLNEVTKKYTREEEFWARAEDLDDDWDDDY